MGVFSTIKRLVEDNVPGYSFQFDTDKMMNVLADDEKFPCVFMEEYTDGGILDGYRLTESRTVELSFMDLAEFQCDAVVREEIRDRMKEEAVYPFIKALQDCREFEPINNFRLLPEPPRFDANAVSLLLRFEAKFRIC